MMRRVGVGTECDDDGWHSTVECENGHTRAIHHHCFRRDCPRCARSWAVRTGERVAARLEGLSKLFAYFPRHVVLSPPVGMFDPNDPLDRMRNIFRRTASDAGVHGGTLVIHGWRERVRGGGEWYWSPHAHIIGWGRVASRRAGWIVKVIRQVRDRASAAAIVAYELDHAAYDGAGSAHTWYGTVSYSRIATRYAREMRASECIICGSPEHMTVLDDECGENVVLDHLVPYYTAVCVIRALKPRKKGSKRRRWAGLTHARA